MKVRIQLLKIIRSKDKRKCDTTRFLARYLYAVRWRINCIMIRFSVVANEANVFVFLTQTHRFSSPQCHKVKTTAMLANSNSRAIEW